MVLRRRLFTLASAVSLLLCVATVVLWVSDVRGQFYVGRGVVLFGNGVFNFWHLSFGPIGSPFADWKYEVSFAWFAGAFAVLPLIWVPLRWRYRRRSGCCPQCGYDLTANTSGTCPECGTPIPQPSRPV